VSLPPTIDLDELTKPVPGDSPAGVPLPDAARRDLDSWRKEPDPDFPETSNLPPPEWGKVISKASDLLANTGKDLTAAVRLVEALTKRHGTAGLRDGLTLLHKLATDCWEFVHPIPEPGGDQEDRLNRVNWLNDSGKGGRFPMTVLRMPVLKTNRGETFAAVDWMDPERRTQVDEATPNITIDGLRAAAGELKEVQDTLRQLAKTLDEKMGAESPDLNDDNSGGLGQAVAKCIEFIRGVADRKGVSLDDAPPSDDDTPAATGGGGNDGAPAAVGGGRDQLYRQLGQIAAALRRMEPHSPVPYLIERCVKLGNMAFPDLIRDVVSDSGVHAELDRLLGLVREES
jgi:type VI secretion system protein ImpA